MKKKIVLVGLWCTSLCLCHVEAEEPTPKISEALSQNTPLNNTNESDEPIILFTPPSGWSLADIQGLPPTVHAMVVGKGTTGYPPSLNLSWEPCKLTLRQYLKNIKARERAQGNELKDLGTIRTDAGNATLTQVDIKNEWGDIRFMRVILLKNEKIYLLTATALKSEFSVFYKDFFAAMRSLRFANTIYDVITDTEQLMQLKTAASKLEEQWKTFIAKKQKEYPEMPLAEIHENVFKSDEFQNKAWKPLDDMLNQKYAHLGTEWHDLYLQKLEQILFKL